MAWYPGATKMELQPESDSQAAIRPTQFLVHSIIAPWTAKRTYEYWRDSTNLESHFGLGYEGDLGQFIGTETRADANAGANRRPDGTGAVSIETASNTKGTDPWTDAQIEQLIKLGVWLHRHHGIPLRICRTHDDPGFGYHSLFPQWSTSGTACPGAARIRQFREVVFPGIVARAAGTTPEEDDMPTADEIAKKVLTYDGVISVPGAPATNPTWTLSSVQTEILKRLDKVAATEAAQTAAITKLAGLVGSGVDTATVVAAVQKAIADAVVRVSVDVTGAGSKGV
ncbi:N-acetylmuramoyl-L-alanine amidase [Streptomyces tricolor]|uniref:N-acetylmuramoyl-L-alanine amidase n=1 Tax=Streptomyces tricolor TaxID=68277 RepID=A0ABS9JHL0_9ACTN|nr:N-acetylmuramoyl-L-alanine amidase [Streptomyces tricolor]MCG0065045.1 N-acetylmuramoyl-L-alanine amidase [Streptomyces tricolor]